MSANLPKTEYGENRMNAECIKQSLDRFKKMRAANQFKNNECRIRCDKTIDNLQAHLDDLQGKLISNRR